jgi:hypothetical protein
MTTIRPRRIVRFAVVGLAVAALVAPAAQANHQDGDALGTATATPSEPTTADLILVQEKARGADRRVVALPSQRLPEALPTVAATGFDWRAAAIGAGFAFAVAVLGAGAGLVIRRRGGIAALRS